MLDIPRRLSVSEMHPLTQRIEVFVNDQRQRFVIEYDCDAGTVLRYERSADDRFINIGDRAAVETVRGKVTVALRD